MNMSAQDQIEAWRRENNWQAIVRVYGKLHSEENGLWRSPEIVRQVAFAYTQMGQYDLADQYANQHAVLTPDDPMAHYSLGYIQYVQGLQGRSRQSFREAIPHLLRALELRPEFIPCLYVLGNCYRKLDHHEKAIEIYTDVHRLYQEEDREFHQKFYRKHLVKACFGLAKSLIACRRWEEARVYAELSHAEDHRRYIEDIYHWYLAGEIALGLGELSQAEEAFQQARTCDETREWIHDRLGRVASDQHRFDLATERFERALSCRRQGYIYVDKGINHLRAGQYADALRALELAMPRSRKSQHKIYLLTGRVYMAQQRYQEAVTYYEKAIQAKLKLYETDYPLAMWELGMALQSAGDGETAEHYFQEVEYSYPQTPRDAIQAERCFSGGVVYV